MSKIVKPGLGYIYGEEVKEDSGVVTASEISDTHQRYKVLAIGALPVEILKTLKALDQLPISPEAYYGFKVGDTIIIQKHAAEGDTPPEMLSKGFALFLASRVMAGESDDE
jgi:co-chaperonin GroES (HSP10)